MSLRFITGRSGAGKTEMIQSEIAELLKNDPLGKPIIVIVPDQMTYTMEHSLSVDYGLSGIIRAQVLTFKRLAWRILQETGGITRQQVDGFGYRMLIRSVLEENEKEFQVFRRAANKKGFTEQIANLLKEFSRYCINEASMADVIAQLEASGVRQNIIQKAQDLHILLDKVEEKLGEHFVDSEGHLALLVDQIKHAKLIEGAHIYLDGFESLTTREYDILRELLKHSAHVTVSLPMGKTLTDADALQLFATPIQTYGEIKNIAYLEGVSLEPSVHLSPGRRFQAPALAHVETHFESYPASAVEAKGAVTFIEAANARAEVHALARTIRRLTMEGKRYRDIGILYREPETYDVLFETIFAHYDIPVFISKKKPMLHHPLIEFSRSILEAVVSAWSFEPIFRAIKTDLFFPFEAEKELWRERADRLENHCLERGIHGARWFDEKRWMIQRYRGLELRTTIQTDEELALQEEIHHVRDLIREPLRAFEEELKQARTGREIATSLFTFMEQLQVYEKIIALRQEEEAAGRLMSAAEHEQAWNEWVKVLDQFVLMFGERDLPLREAVAILDEGFDTLEFSQIPPSVDQVTVSTIERSSLKNVDIVFVMGVNEGVLPQRVEHEGILSDAERDLFHTAGYPLGPTSKMTLMDETYMAYRAFTSAREKLYVSYRAADEEGKSLFSSIYISRLQQLVTNYEVIPAVLDPAELPTKAHRLEYISHPRATLPFATMKLKEVQKQQPISMEWQAVLNYYEKHAPWKSILDKISHPLQKGNRTERLQEKVTEELYGKSFLTSVSRIESYYSCPFQHYISYGLKLQERREFILEAPDIGDLFHAALKWISEEINRLGKKWNDLSVEECWALARAAVHEITPYFFNYILLSTKRYQYIQRKLVQIIQRTIQSMRAQAKVSKFHPIAVEAGFGPGEQLPSLKIPLKGERLLELRGRIDRIDATEMDGQTYLRVVDYKSSAQTLDLGEVYYGLSLQMLTYLEVALRYADALVGEEAHAAGVLYMHVHNPMIRTGEDLTAAAIEDEILKSHKMTGYILDRPDLAKAMDDQITNSSLVIPAGIKKGGDFNKNSRILSGDDIDLMRTYVKTRHERAGNAMLVGDTRVYPYKLKDRMPCQYCAYRSICQFDETDPTQDYRLYEPLNAEEALAKMKEEVLVDDHSSETE